MVNELFKASTSSEEKEIRSVGFVKNSEMSSKFLSIWLTRPSLWKRAKKPGSPFSWELTKSKESTCFLRVFRSSIERELVIESKRLLSPTKSGTSRLEGRLNTAIMPHI